LLALAPGYTATVAGLPPAENGFWPRLLGAGLVGIAAGLLLQGIVPAVKTISLAGLITLNLCGAAMLVTLLVLGKATPTRRGKALLWLLAAGQTFLSLIEIAYA
ncbi:MAG: ABC transporter permease, partial [Hyphomicrobiaceae bacterium]